MLRMEIYDLAVKTIAKYKNRKTSNKVKAIKPEIITACKGAKYLSEFLPKLPPNTFINKSTTGVGATTMALESEEKFIVAVPYQSLAINKKAWCDQRGIDVLIVKQGVTNEDIANYSGPKIIVVFDSLYKVAENLNAPTSYRLMVDEVHVVLTSASFRGRGMNTVLKHFNKFKDFVLITATPTPELYNLDAFKNIRRVDIEWPNKEKINFIRDIITNKDDYSVEDKLILLAKKHLDGDIESNAYFFINSVKIITKVVKALIKLKLVTSDLVNLIVAEGNNSNLKVNLGKTYSIGKPPSGSETAKKLNFITSTAFEGSDFYDENGKIYIISDGSRSHTKIDILTQLHQIAGRIRNSQLNKSIQIITVPTPLLLETDQESFEAGLKSQYEAQKEVLDMDLKSHDKLDNEDAKEIVIIRLLREVEINPFYIEENGFPKMNELYVPSQIHSWKVLHQSYVYTLNENNESVVSERDNCGIEFTDKKVELPPKALGKAMLGKGYNFKELAIMYLKARKKESTTLSGFIAVDGELTRQGSSMSDHIGEVVPLLHEAYRILGPDLISSLNYNRARIQNAIDEKAPINNVAKHLKIKKGWYSNKEIKQKLQVFYSKIDPVLRAKATDIHKFYVAKNRSKRIAGKPVKGMEIIERLRYEKK